MSTPGAFRRDTGSGTGEPAGEADRRDQSRFLDVLFDEGSKEGGRHAKDVDWPCNIRSSLLFVRPATNKQQDNGEVFRGLERAGRRPKWVSR